MLHVNPQGTSGYIFADRVPKQESGESYFCQWKADFSVTSAEVAILFPAKLQIALKEKRFPFYYDDSKPVTAVQQNRCGKEEVEESSLDRI